MSTIQVLLAGSIIQAIGVAAQGQSPVQSMPAAPPPIIVPTAQAQLFIDDTLIDTQSDLKRTLHRPWKDAGGITPIIPSGPGDGLLAYGSIVRDERLGKYVAFLRSHASTTYYRVTSADGLAWDAAHQADLTPVRFDTSNMEQEPGTRGTVGLDLFSCYYNRRDSIYPYQGWMYYANYGNNREGIYFVRSRDGMAWERGPLVVNAYAGKGDASCRVISQDGKTVYGPGDVSLCYHDPVTNRFLGIFKFFTTDEIEGNGLRSRAYLFLDRLDEPVDTNRIQRIALLPPAAGRDGNSQFDEFYGSTAWRYESVWLGGLKVYHSRGDFPFSAAGCAFLKLAVSRDGLQWKKVQFDNDAGVPEVFIPNGPQGGNDARNDGGYISEFSQGPLRIGDELIYYYCCTSYGKHAGQDKRVTGGGMFRARLRVDGFVSVDGGTLTTRHLKFSGDDLRINGVGPVVIELLTAEGKKIGGTAIAGDSLQHRIVFEGKTLRQLAPDGHARLAFNVRPGGHLYAFSIQ